MTILLPLTKDEQLAEDFTKSVAVCLYDTETKLLEHRPINFGSDDVLMDIIEPNVQYLIISPHMNSRALRILQRREIETYKAIGRDPMENIAMYGTNSLITFELFQKLSSTSCGESCATCSTSDVCSK